MQCIVIKYLPGATGTTTGCTVCTVVPVLYTFEDDPLTEK